MSIVCNGYFFPHHNIFDVLVLTSPVSSRKAIFKFIKVIYDGKTF